MAVINVPEAPPWIVARWAFRSVLGKLLANLTSEADKEVIRQALALDGLHFSLLDSEQARRIALALEKAAEILRSSLIQSNTAASDPRDHEFVDYLATLKSNLHNYYEPGLDVN